jgi:hypothetical protein
MVQRKKVIEFTSVEIQEILRLARIEKGSSLSKLDGRKAITKAQTKVLERERAYLERQAHYRKIKREKNKSLIEETEKTFEWRSDFTIRR